MADAPQGNVVEASFIDRPAQRVLSSAVVVPAGLSGWDQRLTIACHERAFDYGYTHWVQPYRRDVDAPQEWLVFSMESARKRQFLKCFPSLAAAEVWVLSHD